MKYRNIYSDINSDFLTEINASKGLAKVLANIQETDLPTGILPYEDGDLVFLNKAGEAAKLAMVFGSRFVMNYGETIPLLDFAKNGSIYVSIPVNAAEHIPATYNTLKAGDPVYVKYVVGTTGTAQDFLFVATETDNTKPAYQSQVIYFTEPVTNGYKIGTFEGQSIDGGKIRARIAIDPAVGIVLTRSIAPMAAAMDSGTRVASARTNKGAKTNTALVTASETTEADQEPIDAVVNSETEIVATKTEEAKAK